MVRNQRWKLLHASGFGRESFEGAPEFELYDLSIDPLETRNVIAGHPGVFTAMRQAYDDWFDDVSRSRPDNYAPPAIYIGAREANPVQLTRQDWRHTKGQPWGRNSHGHWIVDVRETGRYEVTVYPKDADLLGRVTVTVGSAEWFRFLEIPAESTRIQIELTERGRTSIRASYEVQGARMGPHQLEVRRLE